MKTYVATFTSNGFGRIQSFASKAAATKAGNGGLVFTDEAELIASHVSNAEFVDFYNHHNPQASVKRFSDRAAAAKRILALVQAKAPETEKEPAGAAEGVAGGKRGRKSEFSGKKLFPTVVANENPRRAGTISAATIQLIIDQPGITYEALEAAGGRSIDVRWDLAHGWIRMEG